VTLRTCPHCGGDLQFSRPEPVPFEPLANFVSSPMRGWQGQGIRGLFGGDEAVYRGFYRARRNGWLTPSMADRIACALGKHPSEIWPEDWWA
jgi:hypothetical protein